MIRNAITNLNTIIKYFHSFHLISPTIALDANAGEFRLLQMILLVMADEGAWKGFSVKKKRCTVLSLSLIKCTRMPSDEQAQPQRAAGP